MTQELKSINQRLDQQEQKFSQDHTDLSVKIFDLQDHVSSQDQLNEANFLKLQIDHGLSHSENAAKISAQEEILVELKDQVDSLEAKDFHDRITVLESQQPFLNSTSFSPKDFAALEERIVLKIIDGEAFVSKIETPIQQLAARIEGLELGAEDSGCQIGNKAIGGLGGFVKDDHPRQQFGSTFLTQEVPPQPPPRAVEQESRRAGSKPKN